MSFTYTPDLTGLKICIDPDRQCDLVLSGGHPRFLIPDFHSDPNDISWTYEDYINKKIGKAFSNGGSIDKFEDVGRGGLIRVEFRLYDVEFESDLENVSDWVIEIEGYVIDESNPNQEHILGHGYFIATKVAGDL
jgi:hypothetical protein